LAGPTLGVRGAIERRFGVLNAKKLY
jgi:hypothetical protein